MSPVAAVANKKAMLPKPEYCFF